MRDAQLADVSAQLRLDAKENLRLIPKYFHKQSVVDFLDILSDLEQGEQTDGGGNKYIVGIKFST